MVSKKYKKELATSCVECCEICHMTDECKGELKPFERSFEEFESDLAILMEYENVRIYGRKWRALFSTNEEIANIISPIILNE